jgi:hypothetical protein
LCDEPVGQKKMPTGQVVERAYRREVTAVPCQQHHLDAALIGSPYPRPAASQGKGVVVNGAIALAIGWGMPRMAIG